MAEYVPTWARIKDDDDPDADDYNRAAVKAREAEEKLAEAADDVEGDAPRQRGLEDVAERAGKYADALEDEADPGSD